MTESRLLASPVPVLLGPTASGKTAVSLPLAEAIHAEIVCVDSRQVYRGMEIGSAAPTAAERRRVRHHLVAQADPRAPLSAGEHGRQARRAIAEIRKRNKEALLVGGSGLYLRAVLGGLDESLPHDEKVRQALRRRLETEGVGALHAELAEKDPPSAIAISVRDAQRVTRALEVIELTGRPVSELRTRGRTTRIPASIVVLERDPADLELRIRRRVREMIRAGLEEEVRALESLDLEPDNPVLRSVGYAETLAYLRGKATRSEWIETIVVHTRRLAKRQRTWFRSLPDAVWIQVPADEDPHTTTQRVRRVWEKGRTVGA